MTMKAQPNKASSIPNKLAEQASFAMKIGTTAYGSHSEPFNHAAPPRRCCCGCFPLPAGTVLILVLHLVIGIYSTLNLVFTKSIPAIGSTSISESCSFAVSTVLILAYLAMLYGEFKRNVNVYRLAAKWNVVLFLAATGLMVHEVLIGRASWPMYFDSATLVLSIMCAWFLLFGYWTWVLYKDAEAMQVEIRCEDERREGKGVGAIV
ncbi:hypothetical protein BCR44DRAFT_41927 [Catenaria anguillulae PL171]|uniref:Uncharacterized protein n=1 Tax=Catenaria anguillulae PL171 TaxID=765915 RepID=A0A1Y2HQB6_9FUNG|nr:hypothetical protein BCR44DRAFT_41927 [Catenaria anguillulae PL171]